VFPALIFLIRCNQVMQQMDPSRTQVFGVNPSDVRRILRASCATTLASVPQFHRWSVALRFLRAHFTTTVPVIFGWTEQKYV
jgi:hypothetical protein